MQDISWFNSVSRIVFGKGAIDNLGEEIIGFNAKKALIVTDKGICKTGIHNKVVDVIKHNGLECAVFDEVLPDPDIATAKAAADTVRKEKADIVIGLGGGSPLDIAKAAAISVKNPDPIETYAGVNLVPNPGLPTIMIPTTAGTGSEVTSISVLSDTVNEQKKGIVSKYMFAKAVFLDPELTVGLPPTLTASTGLDTLIHALESYVGKRASYITKPLALESIRLVGKYLRRAYANGHDIEARSGMLQASLLAGMAFGNTQSGAAHALGHALGAKFHIPHGISTSIILLPVMKFNAIAAPEQFANIAVALGENDSGCTPMEGAYKAIKAVKSLIEEFDFPLGLEKYGVRKEDIPQLTEASIAPAKRLWDNNPRNATPEQVAQMFEEGFADAV